MSKRRLTGDRLRKIREMVRAEQPLCPECQRAGQVRGWDELDHIVPLHLGGTDDRANLVGLCRLHHDRKTRLEMGWRGSAACDASGVPLDPMHHWRA